MFRWLSHLILGLLSCSANKATLMFIAFSLCYLMGPVFTDPGNWKEDSCPSLIITKKIFLLAIWRCLMEILFHLTCIETWLNTFPWHPLHLCYCVAGNPAIKYSQKGARASRNIWGCERMSHKSKKAGCKSLRVYVRGMKEWGWGVYHSHLVWKLL
jgi:hypothetical protein